MTTPSGDVWTVRRCWVAKRSVRWQGRLPFRRTSRSNRRKGQRPNDSGRGDWLEGVDFLEGFGENPLGAVVAIVAVILIALLGWFFLVPLLLAILDLALLILLTLLGLAARVVLRRPWEIEAIGPQDRRLTWQVTGWQRSRRAITAVATRLSNGQIPPTDSPHFPPI